MKKIYFIIIICLTVTLYKATAGGITPSSPDHFRVELSESITKSCQIVMSDTIILTIGSANTRIGDELCIPVYASNFKDIVSFQIQFGFDPDLLQFSHVTPHPSLDQFSYSDANANEGRLRTLWLEDGLSSVTIDSLPLMELCFQVVAASDVPTYVNILEDDDFVLEIVNNDLAAGPNPVIIHPGLINITNTLDCGPIPICKENQEHVFAPDMVLHKGDIIEQFDLFMTCYGYHADEIKLINLSDPNAVPSDSLVMTCDNVYGNTSIGVALILDTIALVLCHTIHVFNIPDNLENCSNTTRSCLDPINCKSAAVTVTELNTVVDYNLFLSDESSTCTMNIYSQYESIATIPDEYPNGFVLSCNDYSAELPIRLGVDADINGYTIVMLEWCAPILQMDGYEDVCQDAPIDSSEISIRIRGGANKVTLNGSPLDQKGPELYVANMSDIKEEANSILVDDSGTSGLINISTLDFVMMYKLLTEESGHPIAGIASDIDLSGSLTTKDLWEHRLNILGVNESDILGTNFLIEKDADFTGFSYLDFDNSYGAFTFDRSYISDDMIELEVFHYGNLSDAVSDFHKNYVPVGETALQVPDVFIRKGEVYDLPLQYTNDHRDPTLALNVALDISDIDILDITYANDDRTLLHHQINEELRLSFFSPKKAEDIHMRLKIKATKTGHLSDLIQVIEDPANEAVTENLNVSYPILEFNPIKETITHTQVFPNPATEHLSVRVPDEKIGALIKVYNSIGQTILSQTADQNLNQIRLNDIVYKGLIHVVVNDEDGSESHSIMIH